MYCMDEERESEIRKNQVAVIQNPDGLRLPVKRHQEMFLVTALSSSHLLGFGTVAMEEVTDECY